jgi:hypothetical protein
MRNKIGLQDDELGELGERWKSRGDRDGEGDEGRRRYLKEDGDIEINHAPCDIRQHGPI